MKKKRMTWRGFLDWNSGDDRRYELVGGETVAMAPPSDAHGLLDAALQRRVGEALDTRPPCAPQAKAGILIPDRADRFYIADIAVTCAPHRRGHQVAEEPILIVEVLSPSTENQDRKVKLPDYRRIASLREIALVDQERIYVEVHRRIEGDRWIVDILRDRGADVLSLESVGLDLPLATLYANVDIEE